MDSTPFDDLTDIYEAMIDWPKRLANEEPFYRRLFARVGAKSVVDVACGGGRHAAMFHSWGLRVEGADVSPAMIQRAKDHFGQPPGLRWDVRGFDTPIESEEPFDVAVCVGNSLALAPDRDVVELAVRRMFEAVRPGGAVVLHALNLWRLADGPCVWQKCVRADLPQGDVTVVKGVHRAGSRGFVDLVVTTRDDVPVLHTESVPFLGLESADLQQIVRNAGARKLRCFGDYQERPFGRSQSVDLVAVAEK